MTSPWPSWTGILDGEAQVAGEETETSNFKNRGCRAPRANEKHREDEANGRAMLRYGNTKADGETHKVFIGLFLTRAGRSDRHYRGDLYIYIRHSGQEEKVYGGQTCSRRRWNPRRCDPRPRFCRAVSQSWHATWYTMRMVHMYLRQCSQLMFWPFEDAERMSRVLLYYDYTIINQSKVKVPTSCCNTGGAPIYPRGRLHQMKQTVDTFLHSKKVYDSIFYLITN